MRHTETFHRTDELVKGYRALKAAKIFKDYPEVHTVEIYERGGPMGRIGAPPQGTAYYLMSRGGQWGHSASLRLSEADLTASMLRTRQTFLAQQEERKQQFFERVRPVMDWLLEQKLERCFTLVPTSTVGILMPGMLLHERFHDVGGSMAFDVSNLSNADIIAKIEEMAVGHAKIYHKEHSDEKGN